MYAYKYEQVHLVGRLCRLEPVAILILSDNTDRNNFFADRGKD